MSTTITTFDLGAFRAAIEARDAEAQLAFYAPDATIEVVDAEHGPSTPLVARGSEQVAAHLRDVYGRDSTHSVQHGLRDGQTVALDVSCAYPDGARVRCQCVLELRDGLIARQVGVQAWDS
jgi:hypothetical protein